MFISIQMDLAFDNLQWLMCHKTKPNQTRPKRVKNKSNSIWMWSILEVLCPMENLREKVCWIPRGLSRRKLIFSFTVHFYLHKYNFSLNTFWTHLAWYVWEEIRKWQMLMHHSLTRFMHMYTYMIFKWRNWYYHRITMTRKSGKHLYVTYGALNNCFDLIRSFQQCTPWSPPLEIEPTTTVCRSWNSTTEPSVHATYKRSQINKSW